MRRLPRKKISAMVKPQLEYYRENCNFQEDELKFFNLRARNKSLIEISIALNMSESGVCNLSRRVHEKMQSVDSLREEN